VFGLLGGNAKAVEKVCASVDDYLYAFYSANLLQQFDQYLLTACPGKGTPDAWRYGAQKAFPKDIAENIEHAEQAIGELIQRLRQGPATSNESAQPMKIIQSYLLADEVGSLIHTVGAAVAETATLHGTEDILFLRGQDVAADAVSLPELEVALNPQTLRIAAHMSIIFGILNPGKLQGDELSEDENVLVAYIQALRVAGKRDTIPLYASRLQRDRYIAVLSRTLQDVTSQKDQRDYLGIIREFDLDIVAIMTEQLNYVMQKALRGDSVGGPLRILERTEETKLHPGRRIILNFLHEEYSQEDEAVASSLSWFQLTPGGWKVTFEALSLAVRKCLREYYFANFTLRTSTNVYRHRPLRLRSFDREAISIRGDVSPKILRHHRQIH
jgi:nuclear pore complex protein Nup107